VERCIPQQLCVGSRPQAAGPQLLQETPPPAATPLSLMGRRGVTAKAPAASAPGQTMPAAAAAARTRAAPADAQRTRCCRGLTYFSQAMLETGKLPVGAPQVFWAHRWRASHSKADIAEAILILRQHA